MLLSEIDKWSQKYMLYRKAMAALIALLIVSIVVFFLTLNSVNMSMVCLIIIFITVIGIRICMGKMDEFKSLYVNTVPMIDPEKDFKEEKESHDDEITVDVTTEDVESLMEEFVCEEDALEFMTEALVEEPALEVSDVLESELVDLEEMASEQVLELISGLEDLSEPLSGMEEVESQIVESILMDDVLIDSENLEASKEIVVFEVDLEKDESVSLDEQVEAQTPRTELETDLVLEEFVEPTEETVNPLIETVALELETLTLEEQVLKTVESILHKNGKEIGKISAKTVGNYFTIYGGKRILCRLKLTGRKQYVLTQLTEEQVLALGLQYEMPAKSEAYQSRINFTSLDVLNVLEPHLAESYDRCF